MTKDITGYKLSTIEKDSSEKFVFPQRPCGVLPFFINDEKRIIWGCVETNRVGVKSVNPPAGTQDLIVIKDDERIVIEVSKPFPQLEHDFLKEFIGKPVVNQTYQNLINCFVENGYNVYLESELATAVHETQEEHGVDLRKGIGLHNHLLENMFDMQPQVVLAKRGTTTQKLYIAQLSNPNDIQLNYTPKIEEKILINKGREFYEKGIWSTLEGSKLTLAEENAKLISLKEQDLKPAIEQLDLMQAELKAFASRIELIEKVESSITAIPSYSQVNSTAALPPLELIKLKDRTLLTSLGFLSNTATSVEESPQTIYRNPLM